MADSNLWKYLVVHPGPFPLPLTYFSSNIM
jgi:hypothetical protein